MKKIFLIFILFVFITSLFGLNARDYFQKAKWEIRRGNLYSAIHLFKKALKHNSYYRQCYEGLAQVYIRLGNYYEAYKNLRRALKFDMNDIDNLIDMAIVRMKLARTPGQVLAAEFYLQRAYSLKPRNKRVLINYGDYFLQRGFYDKAIRFYKKALLVDSRDFKTYIRLSRAFRQKGDRRNTEKYLKLAEEINSRNEISNFELGYYYYKNKNYNKAEKYFRIAISIKNNYKRALHYLVDVYFIKKDWEKAIFFLRKLTRLTPRDNIVYYKLGVAMAEHGANQNDKRLIERAIRILRRGLINRISDDMIRLTAEEIAVKKLKIGNKYRKILANYYWKLAGEYIQMNMVDRAVFSLKRGIRLHPKSVRFRLRLAEIYRKLGYIDRFYRDLLLIKRDITQTNRRVNDSLMFMRNRVVDTLAYRENLRQYEIDRPRPKIVISILRENKIYSRRHTGIKNVVRELLHEAMLVKGKLNLFALSAPYESEESILRNHRADILLRGSITERSNSLTIKIDLITISTGNTFASFSVTKKGNHKITEAVIDLANRVNRAVPVFGKIIKKSGYTAVINVGRWHGFKKGDEFEIYKTQRIVRDLLSGYPVKKRGEILGTMKITRAGEMISKVELKINRYIIFNSINLNDVIVYKKKTNTQARAQ